MLQKAEYKEIREKLFEKINGRQNEEQASKASSDDDSEEKVQVKFLLTHPAVADLRADQEARRVKDIGGEIIKSLMILRDWNVPPENVRLYLGTPTIFAIKTRQRMLLNPYAYGTVAFNSPCFIIKNDPAHYFYFYNEYNKAHFSAWDSNAALTISDFNKKIKEFSQNLDVYTENIEAIKNIAKFNKRTSSSP
ncbi:MAG: hypothetical protein CUN54_08655 [Phototrophicales bacterium]|nr:MAG: hypothetical protein CUN54_08655 [Phototrophicales bacterium]